MGDPEAMKPDVVGRTVAPCLIEMGEGCNVCPSQVALGQPKRNQGCGLHQVPVAMLTIPAR
jgi:hypothetical protein